jgi:hypothetical protein
MASSMGKATYLFGLATWLACAQAGHAAAQSAAPAAPAIVVVVASGHGLPAVERMDKALGGKLGLRLISQQALAREAARPDALLALSVGSGGKDLVVNALYWDSSGRPDSLSAPLPPEAERVETAVLTLAAALLQRHLPELGRSDSPARRGNPSETPEDRESATRALYAAIARAGLVSPRSARLYVEDF